ncbi:hypothetical protein Pcinc_029248 [Petrolisthes cinctipes]|uniref:Methyltransferase-like protein 4 n=1 Tax=Petrolisthes cinctipes TaxID=88211 RepID=A0AAE1K663_PETCI|nr:hypothetical protein Pcinc_029248 [Petrolisthes cinctipes]
MKLSEVMSVIFATEQNAILDHEDWLIHLMRPNDDNEENTHNDINETTKKMLFQELFDLRTPFLMDGQAHKVAAQLEAKEDNDNTTTEAGIKERKRKRKKEESRDESDAEVEHIQEVFTALRQTHEFMAHFQYTPTTEDFKLNNSHIRDLRKRFTEASSTTLPVLDEHSRERGLQFKTVNGEEYILPPDVHYVCDDAANLLNHTKGKTYDLVVLDPPWQNKYIKRQKRSHGTHHGYGLMTVESILQLPIGRVLNKGALVVIWCTNNKTHIQEFLAGLHHWGVQLVATWYWVKVTKGGELVTSFKSNHNKRPYERLFIARSPGSDSTSPTIPDGLVFCSVPSALHSHKPPLNEFINKYLPPQPQCLEVFARSLIPGWTSYGLEVLRLQHSFMFQNVKQ